MSDNNFTRFLLAVAVILLAFGVVICHRDIERIESSYVTQEQLDSVLTDIFD